MFSSLPCYLLGPNILLSTLFSIMNIYFCLENRRKPIMCANVIQLHKTFEILSMHASAPVFLWPANFSDFHLSTSIYQCNHRTVGWLCFCQILTNFMLQYDPCKANSKLIKNSFSLLNFSVYSYIHKIRALDSMLGQRNPDQIFTPYFSKTVLILSLYLSSKWSCHRGLLTKML